MKNEGFVAYKLVVRWVGERRTIVVVEGNGFGLAELTRDPRQHSVGV